MEGKMHVQTLQSFTLQMGDTYVVYKYIYIYHIFNRFTIKHKKDPIFAKKNGRPKMVAEIFRCKICQFLCITAW